MNKPKSEALLKELLNSMEHRERFVFKLSVQQNNDIAESSGYKCSNPSLTPVFNYRDIKYTSNGPDSIEIYCTEVETKNGYEVNIKIQLVDCLGKLYKGKSGKAILNRSKYMRLHSKYDIANLYKFITDAK
tara:strand:- start:128 stop:520 length:393 start_codon:yes stop_codon:yes gene_type:complete